MNKIMFYRPIGRYSCFSNFSRDPVRMKDKTWPTSEHYFQAQKFVGTEHEEQIRLAETPNEAANMGRSRKKPLRTDWELVKDSIMYGVVYEKFSSNENLRKILLETGNDELIEHTRNDNYWGDGSNGTGRNQLGKTLMRVRKELREGR